MGLHAGGVAGQLILQIAEDPPVVLGKHRVSPHPPSQPADSQLQFREMPRSGAALSDRQAGDAALESEGVQFSFMGRAAADADRLPRAAQNSQTTGRQISVIRWASAFEF